MSGSLIRSKVLPLFLFGLLQVTVSQTFLYPKYGMVDFCITFFYVIIMDSQVSSAVPEGKGVSSSAAVEVATMSAIAAAHGQFGFYLLWLSF